MYDKTHRYGMGVDVAEGIGRDSSTAVIWDFTDNKVVAVYASSHIPPDTLAYEIANMGAVYGMCLIAVERNNHGHATLSKLREVYNQYKIYREKKKDKMIIGSPERFGWATTSASKPQMLYDLARSIAERSVIIADKWLLQELQNYSKDDMQDSKNMNTKHFDTLMACAIGWQMRREVMDIMTGNELYERMYGE